MDQREQIGVRKNLAEHFEGLFAPAHAGEPVVDERDAQPRDHTVPSSGNISGMPDDKSFTGSIPKIYESHLVPLIFQSYAADLAKRVAARAPKRVLEIAAGTGVVSRAIAAATPASAEIIATDLNPAMLEQ